MTRRAVTPLARFRELLRACDVGLVYASVVSALALAMAGLPEEVRRDLVLRCSTNLANLQQHPAFVLSTSAFVVSSAAALWQMPFLVAIYSIAQRWVGRTATILVAALGHVVATLLVAAVLAAELARGRLGQGIAHVPDVGISYGAACLAAFVVSRVPRRLRPVYVAGLVGYFAGPLLFAPTFTDLGHTAAIVLGFGLALLTAQVGTATPRAAA